jgi:UDP-N-acetylglucosamine--N-acetylmuramyl-(pentapeptide) pyrophosphoryl-undecaprenol N-acetylglucosamine transferase
MGNPTVKKCLVMAGGTGGHIFPALAVARELQNRNFQIHWLGSAGGMEEKIVEDAKIPLSLISVKGVRGKSGIKRLLAPLMLLRALFQALGVMINVKPDVVLGFGGFASAPGGFAAWLMRRPLVIHEQNAVAGLTNKLLAPLAKKVLHAFPIAFANTEKTVVTGNPVRNLIADIADPEARALGRAQKMRLLVLGGSLGATVINEMVPSALMALSEEDRPEVIHQCGVRHLQSTLDFYHNCGVEARVEPFIDDMCAVYEWADFVICRSGAMTIAELALAGVGALLVPYPHAVDDHQTKNAEYLAAANAAILIQQSELSTTVIARILTQLSGDRSRLMTMAKNSRQCAYPQATNKVADVCEEIASV